jgi:hypothetical protein
MSASLRALLSQLIDYAGLFPPAKLPLDEAVRNYAAYRAGPDAWMLGRFVCPAARLGELAPFAGLFAEGPPFAFSALGRGGSISADFLTGLQADLAEIASFEERHRGRVSVEVLEVRLPQELLRPEALERLLGELARAPGAARLSFFFEEPTGPGWKEALPKVLGRLRAARLGRPAGYKLRCGGLEASAFPPAEQVAFALVACRDAGVPFKATAGLHHPFRRFDAGVAATMHGFVNLFAAGVLANARGLNEAQARAMLEDSEPGHFAFTDGELTWRGLTASTEEVAKARREAVLSFGSCSFDEPRDDLRGLGWL